MNSFSLYKIPSTIIKSLMEKGIVRPTEIQEQSLPILLEHDGDFVGRSSTGTGKTFAFGIPLLSRIDSSNGVIQAVVLVPTRELCEQVGNELISLAQHMEDVKIMAVYGGVSLKSQVSELSNGVQVLIATPGRLVDLIGRNVVRMSSVNLVVFDEADEMLSSSFEKDVDKILSHTKTSFNTWLFSATMPDQVNQMVGKYLNNNLEKVLIGKKEQTNSGIQHLAVKLVAEEKLNVLLYYLNYYANQKGIIFCRTKSGVQKLYKQLSANGFSSGAIHGNLPQGLRNKVMTQFREGHIDILIATDVASRGIDIADVGFVIQYHIPDTPDAYTHRSGRTSRAGKTGVSLTFIFEEEQEQLVFLDESLSLEITYEPIPSKQGQFVNNAILKAKKIAGQKPNASFTEKDTNRFMSELDHMSKSEILVKLMSYLVEKQEKS